MSCIAIGIDCFAGGASTPATPLSIFGAALVVWVRADLGITTVSGNVSAWADQSGNGNDFAQASAGNRPTYNTAPLNGQPTLRFNLQSVQSLICANYLTDPAPGMFAAIVVPRATGVQVENIYSSDAAMWADDGGGNWKVYNCTGTAVVNGTPYALIANVRTGPLVDQYTNGASQIGLAGYSNNGRGATRIGSDAGGGVQGLTADIGEFIKINRAATAPEIVALRAYFTSFWGFAA